MTLDDALQWAENHPVVVDLGKALLLALVAWFAGVGQWLRKLRRRVRIWIVEPVSRCYIEDLPKESGRDAVRASFLLQVGAANPTPDTAVIERFSLQFRSGRGWRKRSIELDPAPLPARPRMVMANATKLSRTWFMNYPEETDGPKDLTASGRMEPMDFHEAFLLFVSATFGKWKPAEENGYVKIWVKAKLIGGETVKTSTHVKATTDLASFEERVPGIKEHIAAHYVWNSSLVEERRAAKRKGKPD